MSGFSGLIPAGTRINPMLSPYDGHPKPIQLEVRQKG